jgi:hypothetical protein
MNTGNSVRDVDPRCAVTTADAEDGPTSQLSPEASISGQPTQARPPRQQVQDIQEIIDKLAAVNKRLNNPGHS